MTLKNLLRITKIKTNNVIILDITRKGKSIIKEYENETLTNYKNANIKEIIINNDTLIIKVLKS